MKHYDPKEPDEGDSLSFALDDTLAAFNDEPKHFRFEYPDGEYHICIGVWVPELVDESDDSTQIQMRLEILEVVEHGNIFDRCGSDENYYANH